MANEYTYSTLENSYRECDKERKTQPILYVAVKVQAESWKSAGNYKHATCGGTRRMRGHGNWRGHKQVVCIRDLDATPSSEDPRKNFSTQENVSTGVDKNQITSVTGSTCNTQTTVKARMNAVRSKRTARYSAMATKLVRNVLRNKQRMDLIKRCYE